MFPSTALLLSPNIEFFLQFLASPFRSQFQHLLYSHSCNWTNWIYKLEDKWTTTCEHTHIDIFPAAWMEPYLYLLFIAARIEEGKDTILDFFLQTALSKFLSIYDPRCLWEISWVLDISSAEINVAGEEHHFVGGCRGRGQFTACD